MSTYLIAIAAILVIVLFGIAVQRAYEGFARRHPELGPYRKTDGGCGCCAGSACASGPGDGGQCAAHPVGAPRVNGR